MSQVEPWFSVLFQWSTEVYARSVLCPDTISVAERSFPLLNLVEMLGQPCLQSVLYGWRQLQDHLDKTQGLKDFKVTPSIHDNMRPLGTQLLKGDRLARLVRKTRTGLCVGKQMIQTVA